MKRIIKLEAWSSKFIDGPVMFYREGDVPADLDSYKRLKEYDIEKEIEVAEKPIQLTKSQLLKALHEFRQGVSDANDICNSLGLGDA